MAIYKIVTVPNEVLRQKAKKVEKINQGVIRVLDNMKDTMYQFDGVGLAAPQIGISKRIIVVDPGDNYMEIINPEITERSGEQTGSEGCLSVPGVNGLVSRANQVVVRGMDRNSQIIEVEAEGLLARIFQHEIDHLDGVLFTDLASKVIRER